MIYRYTIGDRIRGDWSRGASALEGQGVVQAFHSSYVTPRMSFRLFTR